MQLYLRQNPPPFESGGTNASTDLNGLIGIDVIHMEKKAETPDRTRSRFALVVLFNRCVRRDRKRRRLAMIERHRKGR